MARMVNDGVHGQHAYRSKGASRVGRRCSLRLPSLQAAYICCPSRIFSTTSRCVASLYRQGTTASSALLQVPNSLWLALLVCKTFTCQHAYGRCRRVVKVVRGTAAHTPGAAQQQPLATSLRGQSSPSSPRSHLLADINTFTKTSGERSHHADHIMVMKDPRTLDQEDLRHNHNVHEQKPLIPARPSRYSPREYWLQHNRWRPQLQLRWRWRRHAKCWRQGPAAAELEVGCADICL